MKRLMNLRAFVFHVLWCHRGEITETIHKRAETDQQISLHTCYHGYKAICCINHARNIHYVQKKKKKEGTGLKFLQQYQGVLNANATCSA